MHRKLWTKIIFIICICALAFYYMGGITGENLKGGIDLVGGTSLLYEIDTSELTDTYGAAEEVVKVLRKRVDPDNVRNLIWRVVGWGLGIQLCFAFFIFRVEAGAKVFDFLNGAVVKVLAPAGKGAEFLVRLPMVQQVSEV